jgi:hypothetical protein
MPHLGEMRDDFGYNEGGVNKRKNSNFKEKDDRIWWEKTSVIVDTKPIRFFLSFSIGLFLLYIVKMK